jgi:hypothetical protein
MKRKLKGPVSSAHVIGLSQQHFASTPEARQAIDETIRAISEDELRQCHGGDFNPTSA